MKNLPCNPALEKNPKSFFWMPNDRSPRITFEFGGPGI